MASTVKKAVALLSSGLDSTIATLLAQTYDCDVLQAITFDYGQRAALREIENSRRISEYLKIPHRSIELPWFKTFHSGGGLLKSEESLPQPDGWQLSDRKSSEASAKAVWVPNRNGVFIEIAAGIAEDLGAEAVIVGFNTEEAATFPDNTVDYMIAISYALTYSTGNRVQVLSPTARLDKAAIVREAIQHKFPLNLIWSCYEGANQMCGHCESCMRFKRALNSNKVNDEPYFTNTAHH